MKLGDRVGTATVTAVQHGLPPAPARERKRDVTRITEKQFMAQVVAFAKLHGWLVYHTHDSRRSERGFPDLVLVRGECHIWELKVKPGTLSVEQADWIEALRGAGMKAQVLYPSDWFWIQKVLTR